MQSNLNAYDINYRDTQWTIKIFLGYFVGWWLEIRLLLPICKYSYNCLLDARVMEWIDTLTLHLEEYRLVINCQAMTKISGIEDTNYISACSIFYGSVSFLWPWMQKNDF